MKIITRFYFDGERLDGILFGRAYVFPMAFEAYGDIQKAIRHMNEVINSPELKEARKKMFSLTNAIMWAGKSNERMIDFFGIGPEHSLRYSWSENPDIYTWVTRNGVIVPGRDISEVTCGQGLIVMAEEEKYRRMVSGFDEYLSRAPRIDGLEFEMDDFCT